MLLVFELDDRFDGRSAVVFFEEDCLKGFAWHSFEIPSLHYALWAHDFAEFAVEAVLGAVRIDVSEVPSAAGADVHLFDGHFVLSWAHPLGYEFGVGVCAENEVTGRVEQSLYPDFCVVGGCNHSSFRY